MAQDQVSKVNINHGSREALIAVNGLGPSLSQRIIDGRPYEQLSDLVRVSGINDIKLASLLPFLTLEKTPSQAPLQEKPAMITADKVAKPSEPPEITKTGPCAWKGTDQRAAFLIILCGFFIGLMILLLRRKAK